MGRMLSFLESGPGCASFPFWLALSDCVARALSAGPDDQTVTAVQNNRRTNLLTEPSRRSHQRMVVKQIPWLLIDGSSTDASV
jgi:hypothetical protein